MVGLFVQPLLARTHAWVRGPELRQQAGRAANNEMSWQTLPCASRVVEMTLRRVLKPTKQRCNTSYVEYGVHVRATINIPFELQSLSFGSSKKNCDLEAGPLCLPPPQRNRSKGDRFMNRRGATSGQEGQHVACLARQAKAAGYVRRRRVTRAMPQKVKGADTHRPSR